MLKLRSNMWKIIKITTPKMVREDDSVKYLTFFQFGVDSRIF